MSEKFPRPKAGRPIGSQLVVPCDRSACVCETQGKRPTMEDASLACRTQDWCVYAVFDGHGGKEVSQGLRRAFPKLLGLLDPTWSDARVAEEVTACFLAMDEAICREPWSKTVGSTAAAILRCLADGRVFVVNLGDSRALVFWEDGTLVFESSDHKPDAPAEVERIERLEDPAQVWKVGGVARVRGVLSVSRAFGDAELKTDRIGRIGSSSAALIARPDVYAVRAPNPTGGALALYGLVACDGMWDVFSSVEAAAAVGRLLKTATATAGKEPDERRGSPSRRHGNRVCRSLVAEALARGTTDNVTAVLCRIR